MNVAVLGATGKTGRPLVDALLARGVEVRAASRQPKDIPGAETVHFDWADRDTWAGAVAKVDAVYVVGPVWEPDAAAVFEDFLGQASDVRRVVLLTLIDAERLPADVPLAGWERAVQQSGKEWTILRPNWFQQNLGHGAFTEELRDTGLLELPAGARALSFIDVRDVAEAAAVALTEDGHSGRTYVLTGPDSLTYAQATALLGQAAGRALRYAALSPADYADRLRAAGAPEWAVIWQLGLYELIDDGANTPVTDTVERLTGRPPRRLGDYATEYAAVWQTP
ncbi:NAD(P)H-binding protein [Streptomyces sp. NPDC051940]|uniref:NAD(P)H-binding protein n=1 Tax=Streptomyces sp. NPDC051940 TaxID=3155675 RepID=UPI0034204DC3